MDKKIVISLKTTKAPEHIRRALDQILYELERYGRAITTNGSASRFLAYRCKRPKDKEHIYFGWNKQNQKSMIVLAKNVKLERINDNKVKILYTPEFKEQ